MANSEAVPPQYLLSNFLGLLPVQPGQLVQPLRTPVMWASALPTPSPKRPSRFDRGGVRPSAGADRPDDPE